MTDQFMHLYEEPLESTQVFAGKLLDVRRDRVRLPNGKESWREYVRHQGAAVIIAQHADDRLIFVRQHRYPLHCTILELPAGKIDPGEDILLTAQRELLEESGYSASEWRYLGVLHPCVGYSNERIEIFLARGLQRQGGQNLDDNEFIDVLELTLEKAIAAVRNGSVTDSKTITGIFWAEKVIRAGW